VLPGRKKYPSGLPLNSLGKLKIIVLRSGDENILVPG
jgi:hypothetical protein